MTIDNTPFMWFSTNIFPLQMISNWHLSFTEDFPMAHCYVNYQRVYIKQTNYMLWSRFRSMVECQQGDTWIPLCNAGFSVRQRTASMGELLREVDSDCARPLFLGSWYVREMAAWLTRLLSNTQSPKTLKTKSDMNWTWKPKQALEVYLIQTLVKNRSRKSWSHDSIDTPLGEKILAWDNTIV